MGKKRKLKSIESWKRLVEEDELKIREELKRSRPRPGLIAFWQKQILTWQRQIAHRSRSIETMKTVKTREYSLEDLQEAFGVFVKELGSEYNKTQRLLRRLNRAKPGTDAYDDAWAELYVSLNVLETKANTLREILDEISDLQDSDAEDESD